MAEIEIQRVDCDPELGPELERALPRALEIVRERLRSRYGQVPPLELDDLEVDLPRGVPAASLPVLLADAISAVIQRRLAGEGIVRVDYLGAASRTRKRLQPLPPVEETGLWGKVMSGLGLGGKSGAPLAAETSGAGVGTPIKIIRSEPSPEQRAGSDRFLSEFEAYYRYGRLELPEIQAAAATQLGLLGVTTGSSGGKVTIEPLRQGHPLNVVAEASLRKLGIKLVFDPAWMRSNNALGAFSPSTKELLLDAETIAYGFLSPVIMHELHHAYIAHRVGQQVLDSYLHLSMRTTMWSQRRPDYQFPLASTQSGFYDEYMSNEELSTFGREFRTVLAAHLRRTDRYDGPFRSEMAGTIFGMQQIGINATEVPDKVLPHLDEFIAGGKAPVEVSRSQEGAIHVTLKRGQELHHRFQLGSATPELVKLAKRAGKSKEGDRQIATILRRHLLTTRKVGQALSLVARVVEKELAKLPVDGELDAETKRRLRDLTSWPGYVLWIGEDPDLSEETRLAELDRQIELAGRYLA